MIRFLWILPLFVAASAAAQPQNAEDLLRRGLELERQGAPGAALELWQQATAELDVPSLAIATEYLRVATENELTDYYRTASAIYQWGTSGAIEQAMEENRQALQDELERLEPLVENKEAKRWRELAEAGDPALFEQLRLFWEQLDLTPGTLYNERLIEHWQRIAYARKHFTRKDDPPYETDARGPVYVKYGPPDSKFNDRITISPGDANRIMTDYFQNSTRIMIKAQRQGINSDCMRILRAYMKSIENAVMNYHLSSNNDYEIWIYDQPNKIMDFNLIRIFASKSGGGTDVLNTVEEMIPSRAFSMSNRHSFQRLQGDENTIDYGLTPGIIMQWLYYQKLSTIDHYFASRFFIVDRELFRLDMSIPPSGKKYLGGVLKQENSHITRENLNAAPEEISTEEKMLPEIPLEIYPYRLLDEQSRQVFVTFVESRVSAPFLSDLLANQDVMYGTEEGEELPTEQVFGYYRLHHGMQLRGGQGKLLSQSRLRPPLVIDPEGDSPSHSVFVIPYVPEQEVTQVFYAELENTHPETTPPAGTLFPDGLRGLGKISLPQPEPLSSEKGGLVTGDLILGYPKAERPWEDTLFDFVVSNQRQIPEGENLVVHFEAYRLESDEGGIARFEVDYEIRPTSGFMSWTKKELDEFDITLGFETDSDRFAESLEIEAAGLQAGKYELTWTVRDLQNGQSHEQQIRFEVTETVER